MSSVQGDALPVPRGSPDPAEAPTGGLPKRLCARAHRPSAPQETFGHGEWLGPETGHNITIIIKAEAQISVGHIPPLTPLCGGEIGLEIKPAGSHSKL